jgi:hypothetical protein
MREIEKKMTEPEIICQEHRKNMGETMQPTTEYGYETTRCEDLKCFVGCPFFKDSTTKVVEKTLRELGFRDTEMSIEERVIRTEVVKIHTHTDKYSPCFIIEIENILPFKTKITMLDSYYEPRDIYHYECAPMYYDPHTGDYSINENWSPLELGEREGSFDSVASLWKWVNETIDALHSEWSKLPPYNRIIVGAE